MQQLLRSLAAREDRANDPDRGGKEAARLRDSGRGRRMKIEPAASIVASSMTEFLAELNRVAGLGPAP